MNSGDIVRFTASQFDGPNYCHQRSITGLVRSVSNNIVEVDAGLGYLLYVNRENLELVASQNEHPILGEDLV